MSVYVTLKKDIQVHKFQNSGGTNGEMGLHYIWKPVSVEAQLILDR